MLLLYLMLVAMGRGFCGFVLMVIETESEREEKVAGRKKSTKKKK